MGIFTLNSKFDTQAKTRKYSSLFISQRESSNGYDMSVMYQSIKFVFLTTAICLASFRCYALGEESVDAVVYDETRDVYYLFKDQEYAKHKWNKSAINGYPRSIDGNWKGIPESWGNDAPDSVAYDSKRGVYYLFKGDEYTKHEWNSPSQTGYPKKIVGNWKGMPGSWGDGDLDAVIYDSERDVYYLFKGDEYTKHKWNNSPISGYPKKIVGNWKGMPSSWGNGDLDAVVYDSERDVYYLFKGEEYSKHKWAEVSHNGYPKKIDGNWKGVISLNGRTLNNVEELIDAADFWSRRAQVVQTNIEGFKSDYGARDTAGSHVQGIAYTANGRIVINHSLKENGCGVLAWSSPYVYERGNSITWSHECKFDNHHPSSMQASGNIIAASDNYDSGSGIAHQIRFFEVQANNSLTEHLDLNIPDKHNSVSFAYNPIDRHHYVITANPANQSYKYVDIYYSSKVDSNGVATGQPCSNLRSHCQFVRKQNCSPRAYVSSSGLSLIVQDNGMMYLLAQYSESVRPSDFIVATQIDVNNCSSKEISKFEKMGETQAAIKTSRPSFRWAGGAQVLNDSLYILWSGRNISKTNYEFAIYKVPGLEKNKAINRACESNSDCDNKACGRITATKNAAKQCCPSGNIKHYMGYDYCSQMPDGSRCWKDSMCMSGNCQGFGRGTCKKP